MKIFTVVGARPQFIKSAMVSRAIRQAGHEEFILHTGQHYDDRLSRVFFKELELPSPNINLDVGSGPHGWQTGQMLIGIEKILLGNGFINQKPDWVLVYGDTNSTLAGALAAVKLRIPLAHVEAGLRAYNRAMPEEHNRVLTDYCADLLFCPTQTAVNNLSREGHIAGIHCVGDVMYDAACYFYNLAKSRSDCHDGLPEIMHQLGITPKSYLLATIHRPSNTDDPVRLQTILNTLADLSEPVIFPVHPRTQAHLQELGRLNLAEFTMPWKQDNIFYVPPFGYLDMLLAEHNARLIITDSGGVQKEAYFFAVPCLTLRSETEWVETIASGWNRLVDDDPNRIKSGVEAQDWPTSPQANIFGDGNASHTIVRVLNETITL